MTSSLTGKAYWDSTIRICEAALSMLAPFEHQDYYLADGAVESLNLLVRHGRSLENLKNYKQQHHIERQQRKSRWNNRSAIQPSSHWLIRSDHEVEIRLPGNAPSISAKAITTISELKAIIPEIYNTRCFSIDCEFLALKNNQPRLKVLQIAVSKTVGYAILVDFFNIAEISDVLGGVLQDETILRLGWAVRADAQSIEQTLPNISLGRILDLQTLVYQDAVETMKLANAVTKYAPHWEGLGEFAYAKDLSNSFSFSGSDCIWEQNPLPSHALVYAVFDVVSLFALHEQLGHLVVKEDTYWPENVTSKLTGKALLKWYQNRVYVPETRSAMAEEDVISLNDERFSSSPFTNSTTNSSTSDLSPKQKEKAKKPYSTTKPDYGTLSDDDPAYMADLERAKLMSLQDHILKNDPHSFGSSSSSRSESAPFSGPPNSTHTLQPSRHVVMDEECTFDTMDNISVDSADIDGDNEDIKFAKHVDNDRSAKLQFEEMAPDSWGEVDTARSPANAWQSSFEPRTNTANNDRRVNMDTKPIPRTVASPPAATASNWSNVGTVAYSDRTTGSFVNAAPTHDQAGWQQFVKESQSGWQQGADSFMDDYDKKATHFDNTHGNISDTNSIPSPPPAPAQTRKFNTTVAPTVVNHWSGGDGWDTDEAQPDTMTMALPGFKARKTFGPKVVNVYDSGDDITDDDYDDTHDNATEDSADDSHKDDASSSDNRTAWTSSKRNMDTLRDIYYMDDGKAINMHAIYRAEQLDTPVVAPTGPLTVSISIHCHTASSVRSLIPKGLTIYTSADDAYSIALDRICAFTNPESLRDSTIGYFLTSPGVRRICFRYSVIRAVLEEKLGFKLGPVVDLNDRLRPDEQRWRLPEVMGKYLGYWKGLDQYREARADVESKEHALVRKFSGSTWDKEKLLDVTLIFSAAQGAMLHELDRALD